MWELYKSAASFIHTSPISGNERNINGWLGANGQNENVCAKTRPVGWVKETSATSCWVKYKWIELYNGQWNQIRYFFITFFLSFLPPFALSWLSTDLLHPVTGIHHSNPCWCLSGVCFSCRTLLLLPPTVLVLLLLYWLQPWSLWIQADGSSILMWQVSLCNLTDSCLVLRLVQLLSTTTTKKNPNT